MKIALALSLVLAGCASTAVDETDGPQLTPEEQAALDELLSGADGKSDGFGLSLYSAEYKNMAIAGTTAAGKPFALVAGKHERNFPFFNAQSEWDSMLLLVDNDAVSITAKDLSALRFDANVNAELDRGLARFRYAGPATRGNGTTAQVSFELSLDFQRHAPVQLGKPYNVLDLDGIAGLRWRPVEVHRSNAGSVTIDGVSSPIAAVAGELEHGTLTNFKAPEFAIKYDYLALAYADAAVPASQWYGHVTFSSHALYGDSVLGEILDFYLGVAGSGSVTLQPGAKTDGNKPGLDLETPVVIISHHIDLGLADLERQLVRSKDSAGRTAYGLREVFTVK